MAVQKIMVPTPEVYVCHAHSYASMLIMVPNKHSTWKNTFTPLCISWENIAGEQKQLFENQTSHSKHTTEYQNKKEPDTWALSLSLH